MNALLRWDPMSRTQWNPFKDREEWESRVATMLGTRAATGNGGQGSPDGGPVVAAGGHYRG